METVQNPSMHFVGCGLICGTAEYQRVYAKVKLESCSIHIDADRVEVDSSGSPKLKAIIE